MPAQRPLKISFADLTHTGIVIDANFSPLAIGYVAAYLKRELKEEVEIQLFKYPAELRRHLLEDPPEIACFSSYMWNERLHCAFARRIKARNPRLVTIFGGPNYPTDVDGQKRFLENHPEIDFYVDGEGERALVGLIKALADFGCDAAKLKASGAVLPNIHYLEGGAFVRGELLPRITELETIPSPYLTGLMDQFFDDKLHPLMQTSRGCPYSCTFCHDGLEYMSKTRRFSQDRIRAELDYISKRVKVPSLMLADLNWGMFPDDIQTARDLAKLQREVGWPRLVGGATAKNQKDRVIEMSKILGDSMLVGAAVQSTDAEVLENIKRSNIGFDAIVKMAKDSKRTDAMSYSEIILCLPGDTKEKHFKTVWDMMDAGIQDMRTYQFILLPGTEAATDESREKYAYDGRFRVLPRCFGKYPIYDEEVTIAEIHEVCVGHRTMPHDDYLACRDLNLSLNIFNNGYILDELFGLAQVVGIPRSRLMARIHSEAMAAGGKVAQLYRDFRKDEDRNFWKSRAELEAFLARPDAIEAYRSGDYGANQIYKYRATAVFELLEEMTAIMFSAMRDELTERGLLDSLLEQYLQELRALILARKTRVSEIDRTVVLRQHFDFHRLDREKYLVHPKECHVAEGTSLSVSYTGAQRETLSAYFRQYGTAISDLAFFMQRSPVRILYRSLDAGQTAAAAV